MNETILDRIEALDVENTDIAQLECLIRYAEEDGSIDLEIIEALKEARDRLF